MKRVLNNQKILTLTLAAMLTLGLSKSYATKKGDNPVDFKFIGNTNNQPVFLLNMNNSGSDRFIVTLKDLSGRILYTEKITSVQITRKYRLDADGVEGGITVEISNKKDNIKAVYTIKATTRVVDEMTIDQL